MFKLFATVGFLLSKKKQNKTKQNKSTADKC